VSLLVLAWLDHGGGSGHRFCPFLLRNFFTSEWSPCTAVMVPRPSISGQMT
ncbi:uncharacterized protein METZ01_LOCUS28750, partial [marine metagenome]